MRVRFTANYDHRWPSRAMTMFKAGWSGTVKREVADAAIAKGKATALRRPAKQAGDAAASENADMGRSRRMAEPDDAHNVGGSVRDQVVDGTSK
jgi:hypothetical protein